MRVVHYTETNAVFVITGKPEATRSEGFKAGSSPSLTSVYTSGKIVNTMDVFGERALGDLDCFYEYLIAFAKVFLERSGGCWLTFGDDREMTNDDKWQNLLRYSFTNWWGWLREN